MQNHCAVPVDHFLRFICMLSALCYSGNNYGSLQGRKRAIVKYIGLDIGTTSISGLVYDLEQRTVLHTISDEGGNTPTGSAEWERLQDPERILLQVEDILEQLVSWEPDVSGIGLTGQMHGILYINRNGQHVSPLYTWQDGRGVFLTMLRFLMRRS